MINVKKRNGRLEPLNMDKINRCVERVVADVPDVSVSTIVLNAGVQLYDKVPTTDIDKAIILSARALIPRDPNYSFAAARLLLNTVYKEAFGEGLDADTFDLLYRKSFVGGIKRLVKEGRLDARMGTDFDLKFLSTCLQPDRDTLFDYPGAQTVVDRYLLRVQGGKQPIETPQSMLMRVAMGVALGEDNPTMRAKEFYHVLSDLRALSSTPTLFNAGTIHSQMSSCYLSDVDDSLRGIMNHGIANQAQLSKWAGGLGVAWSKIRGMQSLIKSTNGESHGLIPWLKISNDQTVAVDQGGKRKGANAAYLEPHHPDFPAFLELRKNVGDERMRCHDLNLAAWLSDEFMRRADNDLDWYMFSSVDAPELTELWGQGYSNAYAMRVDQAEAGLIPFTKLKAKDLWKKILRMLFETGFPWVCFKDACNQRYALRDIGTVHSSNLCTEITEHTKPTTYHDQTGEVKELGETAVCNLMSINLARHLKPDGQLDFDAIEVTTNTCIRMLDNVVTNNWYPIKEAEVSNLRHRFVGYGRMGFHDVLHAQNLEYDSTQAVELSSVIEEVITYYSISASCDLAAERGKFETFDSSLWAQGVFPHDTHLQRMHDLGHPDYELRFFLGEDRWTALKERVQSVGMRNALTTAIAPTATISYIAGCSQSIEPDYSTIWAYGTLSGELPIVNKWFVRRMKERGLWNSAMADSLISSDGNLELIDAVPTDLKAQYKTAFQIRQEALIDCAHARSCWIDQSQSLNLYYGGKSLSRLNDIYMYAWRAGLKTTYYLRGVSQSKVEKSVVSESVVAVDDEQVDELSACSLEARARGEICESCQ